MRKPEFTQEQIQELKLIYSDFLCGDNIYDMHGKIIYHEVKGWMDPKSKTKLKRMKLYYPEIKIKLIEKKQYNEIKTKLSGIIKFY